MLESLPRRALLRFAFPLRFVAKAPRIDADVEKWDEAYRLPDLHRIDDEEALADIFAAWNHDGLYFAYEVEGRGGPPQCSREQWWTLDGARLCIDTRDARDVRRATRFCHLYYFLPTGGGADRKRPVVGLHKMSRAKEPPPAVDVSQIQIAVHATRSSYSLEVAIPRSCLNGWDPAEHPRIGFFYKIKDVFNGEQTFSATDDLGWNMDPSTWATAEMRE